MRVEGADGRDQDKLVLLRQRRLFDDRSKSLDEPHVVLWRAWAEQVLVALNVVPRLFSSDGVSVATEVILFRVQRREGIHREEEAI